MGKNIARRGASILGAAAIVVGGVVAGGVVGTGTASAACIDDGHGGCVTNYQPIFPGPVGEFLADVYLGSTDAVKDGYSVLQFFS
ncbi:hypothetical protein [Rhodococcus sp. Q]|uniref:hypothetical protein n=1 Tax=Rhodococcus sp. Q TaxID=2502252 RepID=UPI0010F67D57|nr:hypothetical protein [Rhodococcus sp. Q]